VSGVSHGIAPSCLLVSAPGPFGTRAPAREEPGAGHDPATTALQERCSACLSYPGLERLRELPHFSQVEHEAGDYGDHKAGDEPEYEHDPLLEPGSGIGPESAVYETAALPLSYPGKLGQDGPHPCGRGDRAWLNGTLGEIRTPDILVRSEAPRPLGYEGIERGLAGRLPDGRGRLLPCSPVPRSVEMWGIEPQSGDLHFGFTSPSNHSSPWFRRMDLNHHLHEAKARRATVTPLRNGSQIRART
jgi:hypothetical protein